MHNKALCKDFLPDYMSDFNHVRELIDCLAVILIGAFINFCPCFLAFLLVIVCSEHFVISNRSSTGLEVHTPLRKPVFHLENVHEKSEAF